MFKRDRKRKKLHQIVNGTVTKLFQIGKCLVKCKNRVKFFQKREKIMPLPCANELLENFALNIIKKKKNGS